MFNLNIDLKPILHNALFQRMGLNVSRPPQHVKRQCPTSPDLQGKREDEMTMGHSFIFEIFTEDDKEITFDKLAQMARKVNAED